MHGLPYRWLLHGLLALASSATAAPDDALGILVPGGAGDAAPTIVVKKGVFSQYDLVTLVALPDMAHFCCAWLVGEVAPPGSVKWLGDGRELSGFTLNAIPASIAGRVAIAVRGEHTVARRAERGFRMDIDRDGAAELFTFCASSEGLHINAWRERSGREIRVWHAYHYLGYDVEADCSRREME